MQMARAGRSLRIAACPCLPRPSSSPPSGPNQDQPRPSRASSSGLERFMAPKPPLSGLTNMVSLPPRPPSLCLRLPEDHLSSVHSNGLSASLANSQISHKTAWNSAPRTVLREGTEIMRKYLGLKTHSCSSPFPSHLSSIPPFPQAQPAARAPDHTLGSRTAYSLLGPLRLLAPLSNPSSHGCLSPSGSARMPPVLV